MKRLFLVLLFFPIGVSAALNAGVVEGIWFSTPTPSEGESVRIFTAIQNQSDQTITGSVSFLVNSEIVGSTDFFVTKNNIVPVSVEYVFEGGNHDVSAYITSVKEQSVTYTTLSQTKVSVARKEKKAVTLPTNIPEVIETLTEKAKDVISRVDPLIESAVEKIEEARDKILPLEIEEDSASKELVKTVKVVSSIEGLEIWKKAGVIGLTILSFLVRMWFVFIILFVAFVFWRAVRGRRIR